MIVIGSKSLLYHMPNHDNKRYINGDYDVVMAPFEFLEWHTKFSRHITSLYPTQENKFKAMVDINGWKKQYEIELGLPGTSAEWLLLHADLVCEGEMLGHLGETIQVLKLKYLLLTKRSHLIYPVHFEKNITDYHLIKTVVTDQYRGELMEEYYKLRSDEAKARYKQKTPKLNVTVEDFFSSKLSVPTYFVHDHIHKVMAHDNVPAYTMMQPDPTKAWCSKDMFYSFPYDNQIHAVMEESYVIALERYVIPQSGEDWYDIYGAYKKALKRICTTLTSGWFRDFAIENYAEAIARYNHGYLDIFREAYRTGKIAPKEGISHSDVPNMFSGSSPFFRAT